ncbi:hypothetical protein AAFF_G00216390 [Aldrovandia affinis]|uniref:Uncharacterized protein n=1 Tax=Aldrovandia affinis TaxID=143900 RepID=A0AAD7W501_9TELE|nr:hypothetical protein AAFF_G00216390 [Aldrovandia affinis]
MAVLQGLPGLGTPCRTAPRVRIRIRIRFHVSHQQLLLHRCPASTDTCGTSWAPWPGCRAFPIGCPCPTPGGQPRGGVGKQRILGCGDKPSAAAVPHPHTPDQLRLAVHPL